MHTLPVIFGQQGPDIISDGHLSSPLCKIHGWFTTTDAALVHNS